MERFLSYYLFLNRLNVLFLHIKQLNNYHSNNNNNDEPTQSFSDFMKEYPNVHVDLKMTKGIYHDRYIFIDYGTK